LELWKSRCCIHSNNLSHNLQRRIDSSVTIFDYIIKNFKEEVYAPEIQWSQFEDRSQLKNYVIAQFYYNQIQNHLNMKAIPQYIKCNVTKEEIVKYCFVFAKEGMKYIDEGLKHGGAFINEFLTLKELYDKYKKEVEDLGSV